MHTYNPDEQRAPMYRDTAERLRQIADGLRFDYRHADQLRALAAGFERLAERLEQEIALSS